MEEVLQYQLQADKGSYLAGCEGRGRGISISDFMSYLKYT